MIDLTKITTPWALLDDETREALKAHGGPYLAASKRTGWKFDDVGVRPMWSHSIIYRVKPTPREIVRWVVVDDGWVVDDDDVVSPSFAEEEGALRCQKKYGGTIVKMTGVLE